MLNKPKFMCPSTHTQDYVVDAEDGVISFSCIIDGNEAINRYEISVYDIISNSTLLTYDSLNTEDSVFDIDGLFYPVDEKNKNNVFSVSIPIVGADGTPVITNRKEPYYWRIKVWGTSGSISQSCDEVFYCNKLPELSLKYSLDRVNYEDLSGDVILSSKICYFKSTYKQKEGVQLKRYGWRIIDIDSKQTLVDTFSKKIYGTSDNIACSYGGFLDRGNYSIELLVETQNGQCVVTEPFLFYVSYKTTFLSTDFKVEALRGESGVILDWSESVVAGGRPTGTVTHLVNYPLVNSSPNSTAVLIEEDASIIFDYGATSNLDVKEDSYVVISTQLLNNEEITLLMMDGVDSQGDSIMRKLTYSSGVFTYILGANNTVWTTEYTVKNVPSQNVWYVIILSPLLENENDFYVDIKVSENRAFGGLFPDNSVYPSDNTYPNFGTWKECGQ